MNENINEKNSIREIREYEVVKHNDLIQRTKYDLTTQEQKILLYCISKVKPNDDDFKLYKFKIKEFCEICGIDEKSGKNYADLREAVLGIQNKGFYMKQNDGTYISMNWIEKSIIRPKKGTIEIRLDKDMKPYLLQLRSRFTSYSLYFTLAMPSRYGVRLYDILKSYEGLGQCSFDIDQLKILLWAEKYDIFSNFRVNVLDVGVKNINDYSDIHVSYELFKEGRKFSRIQFTITPKWKMGGDETLRTIKNIEKKLSGWGATDENPQEK